MTTSIYTCNSLTPSTLSGYDRGNFLKLKNQLEYSCTEYTKFTKRNECNKY